MDNNIKQIIKTRILCSYNVTYLSNGFVQVKHIISRDDWEIILKPIKKAIAMIEDENNGRQNYHSKLLKDNLKSMFGDYNNCYPVGCPLYLSLKTGILSLPKHQGGDHKVHWKKI